jgi:hypothetical protein
MEMMKPVTNGSFGLPPWMRFIWVVGVPSAIALFLVYRLDGRQTDQLTGVERRLEVHASAAADHFGILIKVSEEVREETRQLIALMRKICVHTARTETQVGACNDR